MTNCPSFSYTDARIKFYETSGSQITLSDTFTLTYTGYCDDISKIGLLSHGNYKLKKGLIGETSKSTNGISDVLDLDNVYDFANCPAA